MPRTWCRPSKRRCERQRQPPSKSVWILATQSAGSDADPGTPRETDVSRIFYYPGPEHPGDELRGSGSVYRVYIPRCNMWLTYLLFYVAWAWDSVIRLPGVDSHSVLKIFSYFYQFYFGYLTDMILKNELYSSELSSDMKQQICDCFVSIHHFY